MTIISIILSCLSIILLCWSLYNLFVYTKRYVRTVKLNLTLSDLSIKQREEIEALLKENQQLRTRIDSTRELLDSVINYVREDAKIKVINEIKGDIE